MANVRTVNLAWERRVRGVHALSRYALGEAGLLALAVPRPLEARTYDLTRLSEENGVETRVGFSVETLLKLEVTPAADSFLGMTADALYLFHVGNKGRFMGERRLNFVDASLSADGQHLFTAFSDMAGASFALAYGEINGRVVWSQDMDVALTTTALSRNGLRMAAGAETGTVWLLDFGRRNVWEFGQSEPVRAVACSQDGVWVAYGTAQGAVGLIDGDGTRQWETNLPGEVAKLVLSGDGQVCAALIHPQGDTTRTMLCCLGSTGQSGWEFETEAPVTGLSLSPDGLSLATSGRGGMLALYNIVLGEGSAPVGLAVRQEAQSHAEALIAAGDLQAGVQALRVALASAPDDLSLYQRFLTARADWLAAVHAETQTQLEQGDGAAAIVTLETALADEPHSVETVQRLNAARVERGKHYLAEARRLAAEGSEAVAERALLEAVRIAPYLTEAREELAALRARRAEAADVEADRLLANGELEAGVAALERAQAVAPTAERSQKLARAQTAMEFAVGMASYNAKNYREAVFQFKKVLTRDPEHAEARRYLGFAQRFAQDSGSDSLSDRFSKLE